MSLRELHCPKTDSGVMEVGRKSVGVDGWDEMFTSGRFVRSWTAVATFEAGKR